MANSPPTDPAADPRLAAAQLAEARAVLVRAVAKACPRWLADDREDIVQLAMLRVVRHRDRGGTWTRGWLYRVGATTTIDEIRRRRQEQERRRDVLPEGPAEHRPDPEDRVAMRGARAAIAQCMETLTDRARAALQLFLLGHTVPEVARMLDMKPKTAENTVYRGLPALRTCVESKGYRP